MTTERNPFWMTVAVAAGVFCVTILAYVASGLGSADAPLNRFFREYGLPLVACEAVFIVGAGCTAMGVDRLQTMRGRGKDEVDGGSKGSCQDAKAQRES
jgi:hypothetical protein